MNNALNNIETQVERRLATLLRDGLPEGVDVERMLIPAPPTQDRVSVLPGTSVATTEAAFLGNGNRVRRDDAFQTRVWIETVHDDIEGAEDAADQWVVTLENVVANNPTLGGVIDGLLMFGQTMTRLTHPVIPLGQGLYYRWLEIQISADCRYD